MARKSGSRAAATKVDMKPMSVVKGAIAGTKGSGRVIATKSPSDCANKGSTGKKMKY